MGRRAFLPVVLLVVLAACASARRVEQRTLQGPTAPEIWKARVVLATGRPPTFDEEQQWENQMETRISKYLSEHPQLANSFDVQTFRFLRQVTVGMSKDQVVVLLGAPEIAATDAAEVEKLAGRFWPLVKANSPTETWLYLQGWRIFFNGTQVVDITQYLER